MNAVIGQEKLVKALEGYTLETAPKTILFLGQSGCGKSWIANAFAKQLDLEVVVVQPDSTAEKLIEYYQCPINKMYLIDLKDIVEKDQNKFLKFIEEPSKALTNFSCPITAFIIYMPSINTLLLSTYKKYHI